MSEAMGGSDQPRQPGESTDRPYGVQPDAGYPGFAPPPVGPVGEPPGSVRTATILLYIAAAFAIIGGVLVLLLASVSGGLVVLSVLLLAIGVAYIVLAGKLRQGNRTARIITVVLTGLSLLGNLAALGRNGSGIIGLALNGAIIYLLMFHRESKRFFGDRA